MMDIDRDPDLMRGLQTRLEKKLVPVESGCIEWTGTLVGGYGGISARRVDGSWTMAKAHRVAWELRNGPVPPGLCVLHACDNPPCCNPAHFFVGTIADNNADMDAKGRRARGSACGRSKLTEEDVPLIWAALRNGGKLRDVAERFGVSGRTVLGIVRGTVWSHVGPPAAEREAIAASLRRRREKRPTRPRPRRGRPRDQRGEKNPAARLAEADVIEIRRRAALGWSESKLARVFGVARSTIGRVKHGQSWAHVGATDVRGAVVS